MKKVFLSGFFSLLLLLPSGVQAQYRPDTMGFASFLNLCQEFSRSNRQELWVVTFWASWNSNSLYQLPALKATYANYTQKPVRFFFLSRDRSTSVWQNTLQREQLPGTHVLISQTEDYEYLKQGFQHSSIPSMFLVDSGGNIYRVERVQQLREMLEEQARMLPDTYASNQPTPGFPSNPAPNPSTNNPFGVETAPPVNTPTTQQPTTSQPATPPVSSPAPSTPSTGTVADGYLTHTVRASETLYRISRTYNVSVDEIRRLNNLNGNLIKIGQVLRIKRM